VIVWQRALGIPDAPEVFEADTLKSAAKDARPALIRTLTHQSGPSIEWLIDSFDLDLSVVSRLAAHTHPRTHRGKDGNSRFAAFPCLFRSLHLCFSRI
jgi:aspartate oxidase